MDHDKIDIERMIELFNHIAKEEGFKLIVNEIDPLQYFSSKNQFYKMIDTLIEHYIDKEEYEKCSLLLNVKKENGWEDNSDEKVFSK
tara:strand:+ start:8846 stop:9106 length:261 start_codon:yes stop_codon:yes gene_type:complete